MPKRILFKKINFNELTTPPTGYAFIGFNGDIFSEKSGTSSASVGGGTGTSGTSGQSGTSGTSGELGTSGTSGISLSGTSGTSGTSVNLSSNVSIGGNLSIGASSASGLEGGEISLATAPGGSLTSSTVNIDIYSNRLRIFESSGNNRGGYFDLTALGNAVSTNLVPTLYLLEATTADITYSLPGSFTEDPCRYSIVSNAVNVSSGWFNTSNYTFTPQKVGYWEITASYDVYRNTEASMVIKKNNVIVAAAGSFNAVAQTITKIVYLNGSTDFINIVNVGGSSNSRSQFASRSWFQARWVGE